MRLIKNVESFKALGFLSKITESFNALTLIKFISLWTNHLGQTRPSGNKLG